MAGCAVAGVMICGFDVGVTVCTLRGRASKLPIFMAAITREGRVLSGEGKKSCWAPGLPCKKATILGSIELVLSVLLIVDVLLMDDNEGGGEVLLVVESVEESAWLELG